MLTLAISFRTSTSLTMFLMTKLSSKGRHLERAPRESDEVRESAPKASEREDAIEVGGKDVNWSESSGFPPEGDFQLEFRVPPPPSA